MPTGSEAAAPTFSAVQISNSWGLGPWSRWMRACGAAPGSRHGESLGIAAAPRCGSDNGAAAPGHRRLHEPVAPQLVEQCLALVGSSGSALAAARGGGQGRDLVSQPQPPRPCLVGEGRREAQHTWHHCGRPTAWGLCFPRRSPRLCLPRHAIGPQWTSWRRLDRWRLGRSWPRQGKQIVLRERREGPSSPRGPSA